MFIANTLVLMKFSNYPLQFRMFIMACKLRPDVCISQWGAREQRTSFFFLLCFFFSFFFTNKLINNENIRNECGGTRDCFNEALLASRWNQTGNEMITLPSKRILPRIIKLPYNNQCNFDISVKKLIKKVCWGEGRGEERLSGI